MQFMIRQAYLFTLDVNHCVCTSIPEKYCRLVIHGSDMLLRIRYKNKYMSENRSLPETVMGSLGPHLTVFTHRAAQHT